MENGVQQKAQIKMDLHFGHLMIIFLALASVFGMTVFKKGTAFFKKSEPIKRLYTYEQALRDASGELGLGSALAAGETSEREAEEKALALLDPYFSGGAVLGESTTSAESQILEEVISENVYAISDEMIKDIPVKISEAKSADNISSYFSLLNRVEFESDLPGILGGVASEDLAVQKAVPEKIDAMIRNLLMTEVPSPAVRFHRLKLLYYALLKNFSLSLSGEANQTSEQISEQMLSVSEALRVEEKSVQAAYDLD